MTSKAVTESFAFDPGAAGTAELFSSLGDVMSTQYALLAVLTAAARALGHVMQTCHWQARGDAFYGDHLLFERLYTDIVPEVDALGEKTVGMSVPDLVHPSLQIEHMRHFVTLYTNGTQASFPRTSDLLLTAYNASKLFLGFILLTIEQLQQKGELTPGIENLLGDIADKHEGHVYLLTQALRR